MLVAEELPLLGLDAGRGTVVNAARQQSLVGLAGALAEAQAAGVAVMVATTAAS